MASRGGVEAEGEARAEPQEVAAELPAAVEPGAELQAGVEAEAQAGPPEEVAGLRGAAGWVAPRAVEAP